MSEAYELHGLAFGHGAGQMLKRKVERRGGVGVDALSISGLALGLKDGRLELALDCIILKVEPTAPWILW
jgi:hypothetical protein